MNPNNGNAPLSVFLSPHHDDAVLFGSFTLIREHPLVVTVFDSYIQPSRGHKHCSTEARELEDHCAITEVLGCNLSFLGFRDDAPDWYGIENALYKLSPQPERVYAPAFEETGNEQHNKLAIVANRVFGESVRYYKTYTKFEKAKGVPVPFEPRWVALKLKAMACYESQISLSNCVDHFLREQYEYYQQ